VSRRPIQRPLRRPRPAPKKPTITAVAPVIPLRSTVAPKQTLRHRNVKTGNGLLGGVLTVTPTLKTQACLRMDEDFFNATDIPRGPLDGLADLLDDHLNNALDGLMSDPYSSCSDCHF
jgi:hypothetical protein